MRIPVSILSAFCLTAGNYSTADTYNVEIITAFSSGEFERGHVQTELDTVSIGGRFFINDVDTSLGPLQEAAFLGKASSVEATNLGNGPDLLGFNSDIDGYSAGVNYVTRAGYILGSRIRKTDVGRYDRVKDWELSVGKYINDRTTIAFAYSSSDSRGADTGFYSDGIFRTTGDSNFYSLKAKQFIALATQGHLSLEGSISAGTVESNFDSPLEDDVILLGSGLTYYPFRHLAFGLSAQLDATNSWEIFNHRLYGSWFATETLSFDISYETDDDSITDIETNTFNFSATFRF